MDITSKSTNHTAARLSNFTERHFMFRGIPCNSIEGILQALKCPDPVRQKEICLLIGAEAKRAGQEFRWNKDRFLYWGEEKFYRGDQAFEEIVEEIFTAAYEGDPTLKDDLLRTGHEHLTHAIGETHQYRTVLTRNDFLAMIRSLRDRAHREEAEHLEEVVCQSF